MFMDSRYFATVLRATLIPCSERISAILLSLMGWLGVSLSTSFLMIERIAVAEQVVQLAIDAQGRVGADRADSRGRAGAAIRRGNVAGKEILELENSAWRQHVFVGSHARDGRFVHAHGLGDVMQHERFHGLGTVVEKGALAVHDRACDLEQGFVARVETLDEPARLLELVLQITIIGARIPPVNHLLVMLVDAQFR